MRSIDKEYTKTYVSAIGKVRVTTSIFFVSCTIHTKDYHDTIHLYLPLAPMAKTTTLMSDSMIKLLNYRIQEEEQSARIYLAMTMWL